MDDFALSSSSEVDCSTPAFIRRHALRRFTHTLLCSACCLGAIDLDIRILLRTTDLAFPTTTKSDSFSLAMPIPAFFSVSRSFRISTRMELQRYHEKSC